MARHKLAVAAGCTIRRRELASRLPPRARLQLGGKLHVNHGVGKAVVVAERQDPIVQALHDAPLRDVELVVGPQAAAPRQTVELRWLLRILGELGCDDKRSQDDDFGTYGVDVKLPAGSVARRRGKRVSLDERWRRRGGVDIVRVQRA